MRRVWRHVPSRTIKRVTAPLDHDALSSLGKSKCEPTSTSRWSSLRAGSESSPKSSTRKFGMASAAMRAVPVDFQLSRMCRTTKTSVRVTTVGTAPQIQWASKIQHRRQRPGCPAVVNERTAYLRTSTYSRVISKPFFTSRPASRVAQSCLNFPLFKVSSSPEIRAVLTVLSNRRVVEST